MKGEKPHVKGHTLGDTAVTLKLHLLGPWPSSVITPTFLTSGL
jgi:hypothetical protein